MAFFDFNLINDPPNDQFVDEQIYLNQNLDKLDTRLTQFETYNSSIPSAPPGTEAIRTQAGDVRVWTGSTWRVPDSIPNSWSNQNSFALLAPVVERPGFTPYFRYNTVLRQVQLCGGLRADVSAGPWPRAKVQITSNLSGISSAMAPVGGMSIQHSSTGIGTVAGQYAGARIIIEPEPGGGPLIISVIYQGDDIGGNFVMLDGVKWFY